MIEREESGRVAILRLSHGKASAMDLELLRALDAAFLREERSASRAVVLTGTGSIFSAGVDLVRVRDGGRGYLAEFLPALDACLRRLLAFEKPLVAAINGHAIAGGCVIACAADRRVLARGKASLGVPELRVGVPFPLAALECLRLALAPSVLAEAVLTGRSYAPDECLARGIVDELVLPERLLPRAIESAAELGSVPPASFARTKRLLRRPVLEAVADSRDEAGGILDAWSTPEVLGTIREYVARTLRK